MLAFILALLAAVSALPGASAHGLKLHTALSQAPPEAIASAKLAVSDADAASQDIAEVRAAEEEADDELDREEQDSEGDAVELSVGEDDSAQLSAEALDEAPAKPSAAPAKLSAAPAKLSATGAEIPAQLSEVQAEDLWEAIDDDLPSPLGAGQKFETMHSLVPPTTMAFSSQATVKNAELKTRQLEATKKAVKRQARAGQAPPSTPTPTPPKVKRAKSKALGGKDKETTKGPKGPIPPYGQKEPDPYKVCGKLCEQDSGMDGDKEFCLTDCHTYVDAGGDLEDLKEFVTDEAYNEKGGKKMKETYEDMTGEEIPECEPEVSIEEAPKFSDMDKNANGEITMTEAMWYGHKMCIPDEMVYQIMYHADVNGNHLVTPAEFQAAGERTYMEQIFDSYLDGFSEGEDEYERVTLPAFKEFDENGDGFLDGTEVQGMLKFELVRRLPSIQADEVDYVLNYFVQSGELSRVLAVIDIDQDGKISSTEYSRGGSGGGMGVEFMESAAADEDLPDPDDLHRDPNKVPGPVVVMVPAPAPAPEPAVESPLFLSRRQADSEAVAAFSHHVHDARKRIQHKHHRH